MKIQNVGIDKNDVKKLKSFREYPNQPYWLVIKNLINGTKTKIEEKDLKQNPFSLQTQSKEGGI